VLSAQDAAMVDALADVVPWDGDANVPADHVENGLELARWLTEVRWRRAAHRLDVTLLDELAIVTPGAFSPGALVWDATGSLWDLGVAALRQYTAREGSCRVPEAHREAVAGVPVAQQWSAHQGHLHRRGLLDPVRVAELTQIPGWQWEIAPALGSCLLITRYAY
jgi:hypothetical protein